MLGLLILRCQGCSLFTHQAPSHMRAVVSSGCCLTHSISLPLKRFEIVSAWELPNFYPSAIILPAESVSCGLTPVSFCCGYVWCEFFIRSMTTKKALQKRRPITLSCGMLEVLWAVPPVWKAREQCFIICWMVSLLWCKYGFTAVSVRSCLLVLGQSSV